MLALVCACINSGVQGALWALATAASLGHALSALALWALSAPGAARDAVAVLLRENESFFTELPALVLGAPVAALQHVARAADASLGLVGAVLGACGALLSLGASLALACKRALVLIGDSAWLLMTFVPLRLPELLGAALSALTRVTLDSALAGYASLLKLADFLSDIPLQSLIGIVSIVVIVRLAVDFQQLILSISTAAWQSAIRSILHYYYSVCDYFAARDARIVARAAGDIEPDEDPSNAIDSLCVICRERRKCVLLLPCRHICLCRECCMTLSRYQRTCPICRTIMSNTVTVYV